MSTDNWFQATLQDAFENQPLNVTRYAAWLGVPRETFVTWLDGSGKPDILKAARVIEKIGGNIKRALPGWNPPDTTKLRAQLEREYADRMEPILHAGEVTGGRMSATDRSLSYPEDRLSFLDLWRESPMWPYFTKTEPAITVTIRGTSMEPTYPDGCKIALGRYNGDKLPQGAPCIFLTGVGDDAERTFKLYRSTTDNVVIGWPLNPEHPPIIFRRQPTIEYVVLGLINPRPQPDVQPGSDLLTKLRGKNK
jgi:hypothetical protein